MALEEKDKESSVNVTRSEKVTAVVFERAEPEVDEQGVPVPGSIPLAINVVVQINDGGKTYEEVRTVPRALVDAGWPGTARTLKATLFTIIDNAVRVP